MIWIGPLALSLGGLTVLFPFLAAVLSIVSPRPRSLSRPSKPLELEVLIPAYNEAQTIERTLESVLVAARALGKQKPDARIKITVALDGPTDNTRSIVAQLSAANSSVKILDRGFNRGKWATLSDLILQSQGFWSALVDAGTIWPEDFLLRIIERLESSHFVGIAPGYRQSSGGRLSRLIWWQERFLKSFENFSGGPISLHGATMIFRTAELKEAVGELGHKNWLNDDVVMGLSLRGKGRIDYLGSSLCVGDCGVREGESELGRRKRMLIGNIQWIGELFPRTFIHSPILGLLALRRVTRLLWAYCLIFSIFSLGMLTGVGALRVAVGTCFIVSLAAMSRRLREAGWISLLTPILVMRKTTDALWT